MDKIESYKKTNFLTTNEHDLIRGCVNNDRRYQEGLYNLYAGKMLTVCFRYSKNREDAEDSLAEGFMKVFENIANFRHEGSFEGWVRKIMVNTSLEKLRKNSNMYKVVSLDNLGIEQADSDDIESLLNAKELIMLIQKLPPVYQMVFNLYSFEGLKHKEIAEKLGISEGTSKSNLSDARTWLKKAVEKLNNENKSLTA